MQQTEFRSTNRELKRWDAIDANHIHRLTQPPGRLYSIFCSSHLFHSILARLHSISSFRFGMSLCWIDVDVRIERNDGHRMKENENATSNKYPSYSHSHSTRTTTTETSSVFIYELFLHRNGSMCSCVAELLLLIAIRIKMRASRAWMYFI